MHIYFYLPNSRDLINGPSRSSLQPYRVGPARANIIAPQL